MMTNRLTSISTTTSLFLYFFCNKDDWDGNSDSDFDEENIADGDGNIVEIINETGNVISNQNIIDDDDEWETASDASDIYAEDIQQQLSDQMSPLEDIIQRSLSALNQNQQQQQQPIPQSEEPINERLSPSGVSPVVANETPSSSSTATTSPGGTSSHVIGMNRRTVEFMTALDRQFYLPLNNTVGAVGEDEAMSTETESPTQSGMFQIVRL